MQYHPRQAEADLIFTLFINKSPESRIARLTPIGLGALIFRILQDPKDTLRTYLDWVPRIETSTSRKLGVLPPSLRFQLY